MTLHDRILRAMRARGATYSDGSFYGLCHETAHGIDLGAERYDRESLNALIAPLPARDRMVCEVVAHAVTRCVCLVVGVPLLDDSVRHSALGTLAFAAERGETDVDWAVEDFVAADAMMVTSERVGRIVRTILAMGEERVVCGACSTAYGSVVFDKMQKLPWQREDGVIVEYRYCLCTGRLRVPHPEMGADVVLSVFPGYSIGGTPITFARVMADYYVTDEGVRFRRWPKAGPAKEVGGMGGCFRREVRGEELERLRAWAKGR